MTTEALNGAKNRTAEEHWYARYNQIYRKRVTYMTMAKNIQSRLKLTTDDNNPDCLRSKAALQQRGPIIWNRKACTCQKCKATSMTTYYTGSLYLSSQNEKNHSNSRGGGGEFQFRGGGGPLTSRSLDEDIFVPTSNHRTFQQNANQQQTASSFQTVIQNSYRGSMHGRQWQPGQTYPTCYLHPPSLALTSASAPSSSREGIPIGGVAGRGGQPMYNFPPPVPSIPSKGQCNQSALSLLERAKLPPIDIRKQHMRAHPGPILPLLG